MGRAFEELGWEVISLDVDSKASPINDLCRHLQLGAAAQVRARLFRHDLGQPSVHRVQQGAHPEAQASGRRRPAGAANLTDNPGAAAALLGLGESSHGPAQAAPLHGGVAVARCQLLHLRLSLPQALGQPTGCRNGPSAGFAATAASSPGNRVGIPRWRRGAPSAAREKSCRTATPRASCTAFRPTCAGRLRVRSMLGS